MVIKIVVRLHGWLTRYGENDAGWLELEVPLGTVMEVLMDRIGFQKGEIGVITVDKQILSREDLLAEGMTVHFYPVFGGG